MAGTFHVPSAGVCAFAGGMIAPEGHSSVLSGKFLVERAEIEFDRYVSGVGVCVIQWW
ncbi:MAG: hypothetical protein JNL58_30765 [Planctomyces sp.]|nr:hypothetical protein [Planctomyces sp.]